MSIPIYKYIDPDFTVTTKIKQANGEFHYSIVAVSLIEGIMYIQQTNENYDQNIGHAEYRAIRIADEDIIEVCEARIGFAPVREEIQNKYNEILAEKEILGN